MEKIKKINVGEELKPFRSDNTEFVNREFIRAFGIKKHFTSAPTYIPTNFYEQIVLAHIGADYKLYLYIDGAWKSATLT